MAGIYLHIPFCKKACHYCDFHFSTMLANKESLLEAMRREIVMRKDYASGDIIRTIYFGGGTPSLLSADELKNLLELVFTTHEVDPSAEITLEANPDDLSLKKITELRTTPINRLSIGIQSFREQDLKWMNRAHTAAEADYCVKASQDKGFENITIDLIYSIAGMTNADWKENLHKAFALDVPHISSYGLTIEPQTVFGNYQKKGLLKPMDQERSGEQFLLMVEEMNAHGYEQYEVSNFCKPGFESKHNSAYWKGAQYIGIGPSAHSFNGKSRQWNVANNHAYTKALHEGQLQFEQEILDERTALNEYLMVGLRTKWGIDTSFIHQKFALDFEKEYAALIGDLIHSGKMRREENQLTLTTTGFLVADKIASDFFILEEQS